MDILWWLTNGVFRPGMEQDMVRPVVTLALAAAVVVGYAALAFHWYLQSKLAAPAQSRAALARLREIVICAAAIGVAFALSDINGRAWRFFDFALALLGAYTWWGVFNVRGLRLVNERLAQVAALEQSAQKYREIAEYLPHAVWTATGDGRVDFANARWRQYAGDDRSWLDAVHPDDQADVNRWWGEALTSRLPVAREIRLIVAGGACRSFRVEATPVVHGHAVQWFGACADVEEQKLIAAEKESQAKQKEFLFNALSHDLRAPLNNVVLNAQLLKNSARDLASQNAEFNESADVVIENALAAGDLVTQLLDYARVGARDQNQLARVSMDAVLHQVERRFLPVAIAKGLSLRVAGNRTVELTTDRLKLERILSNLVDNALKFTSVGGVSVDLTTRPAGGISVRICDTGVGIPEADAPRLFDEFYQAANQDRPHTRGFGMGLAICRSLARQLQGDVTLASTGPTGTCFELTLPDAACTTARETAPAAAPVFART